MRFLLWSLLLAFSATLQLPAASPVPATPPGEPVEYRVLATNKTSTMEKELNQGALDGFRFEGVNGGETAWGGNETVIIMGRNPEVKNQRYEYKLLATNKTSTMQKELDLAGQQGWLYRGQTVFSTTFGGREVVLILERSGTDFNPPVEYRLLATSRTSTMQKEIGLAGQEGFRFLGITVAATAFGGNELVVITGRTANP